MYISLLSPLNNPRSNRRLDWGVKGWNALPHVNDHSWHEEPWWQSENGVAHFLRKTNQLQFDSYELFKIEAKSRCVMKGVYFRTFKLCVCVLPQTKNIYTDLSLKVWYLLDLLVDNDANSMLGYVVHTSRLTMVALVRHSFLNGTCALERQMQLCSNVFYTQTTFLDSDRKRGYIFTLIHYEFQRLHF